MSNGRDEVHRDAIIRYIKRLPTIHLPTLHHGLGSTATECSCIYTKKYLRCHIITYTSYVSIQHLIGFLSISYLLTL